jgi:hypothetical protein
MLDTLGKFFKFIGWATFIAGGVGGFLSLGSLGGQPWGLPVLIVGLIPIAFIGASALAISEVIDLIIRADDNLSVLRSVLTRREMDGLYKAVGRMDGHTGQSALGSEAMLSRLKILEEQGAAQTQLLTRTAEAVEKLAASIRR